MKHNTRAATRRVLDYVEEGVLTWEQVATAALNYMSEDDVANMAHCNDFFEDEDEEEYDDNSHLPHRLRYEDF
jgi:hypothetical protein